MLQCDFSYMISPAMYRHFVLPDIVAVCEHLDHALYHLDGKAAIRHLDALLEVPRLHGIQWVPGDGAPACHEWLPLLKRIRDAGKLCQLELNINPQGVLEIVRELGGRGFAFRVECSMSAEEAHDSWLRLTTPMRVTGLRRPQGGGPTQASPTNYEFLKSTL